ncbi:MAG TPA: type II secretion system protein [Acidimicrobiales bacterium]|nr:type II secretion system protein [Acidimicrobiales bacterium]
MDDGFTLIELTVVLLVTAILLAIAIPIFMGASGAANDRSAQSNLSGALSEVKTMFQPNQSYATVWLAAVTLASTAPEYLWDQKKACTATSSAHCVSEFPVDVISPAGGRGVILATRGNNGTCWYAVDLEANPTTIKFADTGGTRQFLAGTANGKSPNDQEMGSTPLTAAGVYYAQKQTASCDARTPTTKGSAWRWGLSYSTAPVD